MRKIAVIGIGTMGSQIAAHCALKNCQVQAVDIDTEIVNAIAATDQWLMKMVGETDDMERVRNRIMFTSDLEHAVSQVELVIESVPEELQLKQAVFQRLDQAADSQAVLATNSSSMPVRLLEAGLSAARIERIVNLHFYPPITERRLVEVMAGSQTHTSVFEDCCQFVKHLGLIPIRVKKENPGFVFNYLWAMIKQGALYLADREIADYQDIDRAWMIVTGMQAGPFAVMDQVGLDVVRAIFKQRQEEVPQILNQLVEAGHLGQKTGQGFYTYPNPVFIQPGFLDME